jgi:hypothetical protein
VSENLSENVGGVAYNTGLKINSPRILRCNQKHWEWPIKLRNEIKNLLKLSPKIQVQLPSFQTNPPLTKKISFSKYMQAFHLVLVNKILIKKYQFKFLRQKNCDKYKK